MTTVSSQFLGKDRLKGQGSAMFLWRCSSKVVAMFLRLDAFKIGGEWLLWSYVLVFFTT